jgi:hypothetical protein
MYTTQAIYRNCGKRKNNAILELRLYIRNKSCICLPSVCLPFLFSVRPSVCLSVLPSISLTFRLTVSPFFHLCILPSVILSVFLSVYLSVCLTVRPSVSQSTSPTVRLFVFLFVHLSVFRLTVCPSVFCSAICLSVCMSVYLSGQVSIFPLSSFRFYVSLCLRLSDCNRWKLSFAFCSHCMPMETITLLFAAVHS